MESPASKDLTVSFDLSHTEKFCTYLVAIPRPGPAHINQTMPLHIVQRSRPRRGSPIAAPPQGDDSWLSQSGMVPGHFGVGGRAERTSRARNRHEETPVEEEPDMYRTLAETRTLSGEHNQRSKAISVKEYKCSLVFSPVFCVAPTVT